MAISTELRKAMNTSQDAVEDVLARRRHDRMARVDNMTPEQRRCVHDYGLMIVQSCLDLGVKNPRHIRHLVETILNEFSPTRGSSSSQGRRGPGLDEKQIQRFTGRMSSDS